MFGAIKIPGLLRGHEVLPFMDHPLSKHWNQPNRDNILFDDKRAYMHEGTFLSLKNYSSSKPTGAYEGKMWRSLCFVDNNKEQSWLLRWYGVSDEPGYVTNEWREIVILFQPKEILSSFSAKIL